MPRTVMCAKLGKKLPGLDYAPFKGELGQRIYEQVSAEAWKAWLRHSTILINEYRLNPTDPQAQALLRKQMEQFFFGEGAELPKEYSPSK